jgi:hypothetical protein
MPFPVDIQYIQMTEKEFDMFFPPIFKAKMMQLNGGELLTEDEEWNLYPFFDKSTNKKISRTCNHIGLETKAAREWSNFPSNAIAIGSNGSGDQLILMPESERSKNLSDTIYIWRHETGETEFVAANINAVEI